MKKINVNIMLNWKNIRRLRDYKKHTGLSMSSFVDDAVKEKFERLEDKNRNV